MHHHTITNELLKAYDFFAIMMGLPILLSTFFSIRASFKIGKISISSIKIPLICQYFLKRNHPEYSPDVPH